MDKPKTAFEHGQDAQIAHLRIAECPYDKGTAKSYWLEWRRGFLSSKAAAEAASIGLFSTEELLFTPLRDVTDVKTDPKETIMGRMPNAPNPPIDPPPKKRPTFLPKDRAWSKDAEDADDDDPDWATQNEEWKDPKGPKDKQ